MILLAPMKHQDLRTDLWDTIVMASSVMLTMEAKKLKVIDSEPCPNLIQKRFKGSRTRNISIFISHKKAIK